MFNKEFMIGAATAAHQVEGNNTNSDFWTLEHLPNSVYREPSLDAVDHYNRYEEDIKMMADAGLTAYRFSIEWARIQPTADTFDEKEIAHYRDVIECCHRNGVTPLVTLHHFSAPKWLISAGGWESAETIEYFKNYTRRVVTDLGDIIPYICTLNEANMGLQINRLIAKYMKQAAQAQQNPQDDKPKKDGVQTGLNLENTQAKQMQYMVEAGAAFGVNPMEVHTFLNPRTEKGNEIIMRCHDEASKIIKEINPNIRVGITLSLYDYQAIDGGEALAEKLWHEDFLQFLPYTKYNDFVGVQNYTRKICGPDDIIQPEPDAKLTDMGNEYYPEALGNVIRAVAKDWDKEIVVTENGIATTNDADRIAFTKVALEGVAACIEEGINVTGYMHWSLMDNFEWQLGYTPKFGLIEVDRDTQARKPKESLSFLGSYSNK